jgi:hypothetical protein
MHGVAGRATASVQEEWLFLLVSIQDTVQFSVVEGANESKFQ